MTTAEAAELQVKWAQQVGLPLCEHLKVELGRTEDGSVTGNCHCTTCGHSVPR
jgi:hypothetical protein